MPLSELPNSPDDESKVKACVELLAKFDRLVQLHVDNAQYRHDLALFALGKLSGILKG